MESLACGEIGLSIEYFYSLTPRQFDNILNGYRRKQEDAFKDNWERTRKLMFVTLQPHLKKRNTTDKDIMSFPWETDNTEADIEFLTAEIEAVEANKRIWEQRDAKKNKA